MPKPTTHTDIVVVTVEESSTPLPQESIKLTLAANGTQRGVHSHPVPVVSAGGGVLVGPPVGLSLDVGGQIAQILYETRTTHRWSDAQIQSEPALTASLPALGSPTVLRWTTSSTVALITDFELVVYAMLGAVPLTVAVVSASTSTTQTAQLEFKDGATEIGHLTMTAVMDALPAF